jgi:hypothetical protein
MKPEFDLLEEGAFQPGFELACCIYGLYSAGLQLVDEPEE